jgi:hypothetical protein
MQEPQMREHLKLIGTHRHSSQILHIAEDCKDTHSLYVEIVIDNQLPSAVNSYEQALAFLRGEQNTADDFIRTLFTTKASDA